MQDRTTSVSLTKLVAVIMGLVGIALVVANLFTESDKLGFLAPPFVCVSAVLWVRSFLVRMDERERNAFQVGRDSVRSIR